MLRSATFDEPRWPGLLFLAVIMPVLSCPLSALRGDDKDVKSLASQKDWQEFQLLTLKAYVGGLALSQDETAALQNLRKEWESGALGKGMTNYDLIKQLDQELGWDAVKGKPKVTYRDRLQQLSSDVRSANSKTSAAVLEIRKAAEDQQLLLAQIGELRKSLDGAQKDKLKIREETSKGFVKTIRNLEDAVEDHARQARALAEENGKLKKANAELKARIEKLNKDKK